MYTRRSQRTFETRMRVRLLTVPYDMRVLTAKQLYCMTKYDFKHLDEDWNIIHSNWFLEQNKHGKAKAKWLEQSAGGDSLWNILTLMHEVIQCYRDKLMNPEMIKVLFEPVTRRCSLMAYSWWTRLNNLSPIVRKTVKSGENACPNDTANCENRGKCMSQWHCQCVTFANVGMRELLWAVMRPNGLCRLCIDRQTRQVVGQYIN